MTGALVDMSAVLTRWQTWWLMGNQDVLMRYRRSILGPFWISLSMATMILGLALLYGQIFEQDFEKYLLYLAPSLLIWGYISSLVSDSCSVAIEAEPHLRSVRIPLPVLAARAAYRNLLIFLHNFIAVAGLIVIFGAAPKDWTALYGLAGVGLVTLLGFFVALVLGPLCLRFRDIHQIIVNVMQILFFLTPVMWPVEQLRVARWLIEGNPFYHLLEIVRAPVLGHAPTPMNWIVSLSLLGFAIAAAAVSLAASRRKLFLWI